MSVRLSRSLLLGVLLLVVGASLVGRYCGKDERQAIRVSEGRVVVTNLSGSAWSDVDVWLNDFYRAQAPSLAPGQRLEIPLDVFVAGFGQRFAPARQAPAGIEVDARAADGRKVVLTWGSGRRR